MKIPSKKEGFCRRPTLHMNETVSRLSPELPCSWAILTRTHHTNALSCPALVAAGIQPLVVEHSPQILIYTGGPFTKPFRISSARFGPLPPRICFPFATQPVLPGAQPADWLRTRRDEMKHFGRGVTALLGVNCKVGDVLGSHLSFIFFLPSSTFHHVGS